MKVHISKFGKLMSHHLFYILMVKMIGLPFSWSDIR